MILLMKYKLCQLIEHQIGSAIIQKNAHNRNIEVLIAAAGDSAHLPGMVASLNSLPVIGFPVKLIELDGLESMLSIVQMPGGVPVAIVGIKIKTYAKIENSTVIVAEEVVYGLEYKLEESWDSDEAKFIKSKQ